LVYERYFYDGADVVADYDGRTGELRALYLTPFLDENLLKEDYTGPGPMLAWYTQDGLGSVRQLVVGYSVMNSYTYTAWGVPLNWQEHISNRYTFTSREWNPETHLYHYRIREYASYLGKFFQPDRASWVAHYGYAANDPILLADPTGCSVQAAAVFLSQDIPKPNIYTEFVPRRGKRRIVDGLLLPHWEILGAEGPIIRGRVGWVLSASTGGASGYAGGTVVVRGLREVYADDIRLWARALNGYRCEVSLCGDFNDTAHIFVHFVNRITMRYEPPWVVLVKEAVKQRALFALPKFLFSPFRVENLRRLTLLLRLYFRYSGDNGVRINHVKIRVRTTVYGVGSVSKVRKKQAGIMVWTSVEKRVAARSDVYTIKGGRKLTPANAASLFSRTLAFQEAGMQFAGAQFSLPGELGFAVIGWSVALDIEGPVRRWLGGVVPSRFAIDIVPALYITGEFR